MGSACSSHGIHVHNAADFGKEMVSALVSPFKLSREDAEKLLVSAQIGSYLFSYDITSECFVSVSAGDYVCHHAISKRGSVYIVGGECFGNMNEAIVHYRDHPLGAVKLTRQFSTASSVNKPAIKSRACSHEVFSLTNLTSIESYEESWKKHRKVSFKEETPVDSSVSGELVRTAAQSPNMHGVNNPLPSVSLADEEEERILLDEPIPILPGPSGVRPPPLFPRFSNLAEELSDFPFDSDDVYDSKQTLFQLYKGNPRLYYTPKLNMIKLIVTGQPDSYKERKYFLTHFLHSLKLFAKRNNLYLEYIDVMLQHTKLDMDKQGSWSHEDICEGVSKEINDCKRNKIPYILLVYLGHDRGLLLVPDHIEMNDFDNILKVLNDTEKSELLKHYVIDENSTPPLYVLNDIFAADAEVRSKLVQIFHAKEDILKMEHAWKYFAPGCERHLKEVSTDTRACAVFIDRKFYDFDDCSDESILKTVKGIQYKNYISRLIENKFMQIYDDVSGVDSLLEEVHSVTMTTTIKIFEDVERYNSHCNSLSKLITERIKSSIISMQLNLKSRSIKDTDYDEVLHHVLMSHRISVESTVDETMFFEVNKYIRGITNKPFIIYGSKWSGKSSILSRVPKIASDWFNDACCIVCRFIGHTLDSSCLKLLLRNICVQISYAYSTDPAAIPQELDEMARFFPCLLDLPTDSMPLVLAIDSLDLIKTPVDYNPISLIPSKLQPHVKVIVTLNSENCLAKEIFNSAVKSTLPYFTAYRALEYLDHLLVKKDRTLNSHQQKIVSQIIEEYNDPIFIQMLMKELLSWRSWSKETCHCSKNTSESLTQTCMMIEETFGFTFIAAFCFAVSLDKFGIPKELLSRFLETVMDDSNQVRIQTKIQHVMEQLDCILMYQVKSGQLNVCCRDSLLTNLVHQKYVPDSSDYIDVLKKTFEKNFKSFLQFNHNSEQSTSKEKCDAFKYHESLYSFLQRFFLRYGTLNELKQFFLLNYNFMHEKLNTVSLFHVRHDVEVALEKYPDDAELLILDELLGLSKEVLLTDPTQFPLQIACRLKNCVNGHLSRSWSASKMNAALVKVKVEEHVKTSEENAHSEDEYICGGEKASVNLLQCFVAEAEANCKMLAPTRQCLAIPYQCCNKTAEEQSKWKTKDLKLMFVSCKKYSFVGWSAEREEIYLYKNSAILDKSMAVKNLQRVVLSVGSKLVIELSDDETENKLIAFHMGTEDWQNIYPDGVSMTDIFHVFATDHNNLLFCLNRAMNTLNVLNIDEMKIVWSFETDAVFHNIVLCKDATTAICYIDRSYEPDISSNNFESSDHDEEENQGKNGKSKVPGACYEEILVLDLIERLQVMCLSSPSAHYCGKVFALSEDGQYFVRVTEVDVHLLVWNLHRGKLVHDIGTSSCRLTKLLVSSRGNCIVSTSSDSSILVFNLSDGSLRYKLTEPVRAIRGGYMDDAHSLCLSDDGTLAIHSVKSNFHPSFIVVWNLVTGTRISSLTTDYYGSNYYLSPGGRCLIATFPVGLVAFNLSQI